MSGVIGKPDLIGHLDDNTDNLGDEAMNVITTAAAAELIQQHTISRAAKDASLTFAQMATTSFNSLRSRYKNKIVRLHCQGTEL